MSGYGNYIYYEATYPATGDKTVLQGPTIVAGSSTQCMRFAFHMYGSSMGKLQLDQVNADGSRTTLFSRESVSVNQWQDTQINLYSQNHDYHVSILSHITLVFVDTVIVPNQCHLRDARCPDKVCPQNDL